VNQLGKVMNLRAFTIGVSAAFLVLACSGSDDGDNGNGDTSPSTPVTGDPTPGVTTDPTPVGPTATTPVTGQPAEVQINQAFVESMLRTTCGNCHGAAANGNCRAGMCYIESIDELITQGKIIPGNPNESLLYQRISRNEMPPAGVTPRFNEDEVTDIANFILKLRAPAVRTCDDQFISWDDTFQSIEADLIREDADDRVFIRYISLANRYNAGVCDAQLEADRWAMNKFINGISQRGTIKEATQIDDLAGSKSLYRIDLRDYDLDVTNGPFVVNGINFDDGWEAIIGNNNYAVEFQGDSADNVNLLSGTTVPVMYSDAIIDEATVGNLYYGLLRLAANRDDQLVLLDVDLVANQDEEISVFVGTTQSEISEQEAFIRRDPSDLAGNLYYYERFDLDPNLAGESILADPLGFDQVANGSQALFSLPNGLQAYMIFDAAGLRLEESPILFDRAQNDNVMKAGVSCSTCHANGLRIVEDEVRDFALENSIDVTNGINEANLLNGTDFEFQDVLGLYRENDELKEILTDDVNIYRGALGRAGVPTNGSDPISDTFIRFDKDVDLRSFAGDLAYPLASLERDIPRLDPALSGLDDGKTVDRDDAKGLYVNSLCITSVANDNTPADQECIDAGI